MTLKIERNKEFHFLEKSENQSSDANTKILGVLKETSLTCVALLIETLMERNNKSLKKFSMTIVFNETSSYFLEFSDYWGCDTKQKPWILRKSTLVHIRGLQLRPK